MISTCCYCDRCGNIAPLSIFHVHGNATARYTICLEDTGDNQWANRRKELHLCSECYHYFNHLMEEEEEDD